MYIQMLLTIVLNIVIFGQFPIDLNPILFVVMTSVQPDTFAFG